MRRIADAEETRTIPLAQPVDLNRQELDRLPVVEFADTAGHERRKLHDSITKGR